VIGADPTSPALPITPGLSRLVVPKRTFSPALAAAFISRTRSLPQFPVSAVSAPAALILAMYGEKSWILLMSCRRRLDHIGAVRLDELACAFCMSWP